MEESNNVNMILAKKFEDYRSNNTDNYVAPGEITVTITLNEYRNLVKQASISDSKISEMTSEKYKLQNEITALKKEADDLRKRLFDILDGNNASEPKADVTRCV